MANADVFSAAFDAGMGKKKKGGKSDLLKQPTPAKVANPSEFKKGGKVKKTGVALIHKGEEVLTKAKAKKYHKKAPHKRVASKG